MEIIKIDGYLDGGTIKITTKEEIYCIDRRIGTATKGKIYLDYPKDDNSNLIAFQGEVENFKWEFHDWSPAIKELLNNNAN